MPTARHPLGLVLLSVLACATPPTFVPPPPVSDAAGGQDVSASDVSTADVAAGVDTLADAGDVQVADAAPADAKGPEVLGIDASSPDVQPVDVQPVDVQPVDVPTADASSPDAQPVDAQPVDAWQPPPMPVVGDDVAAPCAKVATTGDYFQFLDNLCADKVLPAWQERAFACPIADASPNVALKGGGTFAYQPWAAQPKVDDKALAGLVPPELQVAVIAIRRVGGVPHYRLLGQGSQLPFQPWSTSKFLAAANGASWLRIQSNYKVGLTGAVKGTPLGDLVTSIANYDNSPYASNSLAAYFHDIGGRKRANDLIHGLWLGRPAAETFGGNYGSKPPALGYTFTDAGNTVTLTPDTTSGYANHLSAFTLADALRRLVLHREEAATRLPGLQWADVETLLYGAEGSKKYGKWGGLTADTALYLQAGFDIDYLAKRANGRWTIFSKLGLGTKYQFVSVGYACFPVLDPQNQPVPGLGREFLIAAHLPTGGGSAKERDRLLAKAHRSIVKRLIDGTW